jgi:hypothetical protein
VEGEAWVAAFAVDGNASSRWASAWSDPQWISVDLGEIWTVTEIRLVWETAYATRYRIEVTVDGATWTTVYQTSGGTGGSVVLSVPATAARHVRMVGTARPGGYGYSLWELEVR